MKKKWELARDPIVRPLLCGAVITLSSTVFFQFSLQNFRISTSVMLLPVLLLTLNCENHPFPACACSGAMVLLFRAFSDILLTHAVAAEAFRVHIPACSFYLFYGLLFPLLVPMRAPRIPRLGDVAGIALCELASNLLEIGLDQLFSFSGFSLTILPSLVFIALLRGCGAGLLLALYCHYHSLLNRADHEERYQRDRRSVV